MKSSFELGKWNAICDICGFEFKNTELRKNWRGLMVCDKDYETRNEQDFIKVRPERASVTWARPEPEDVFIRTCNIWSRSANADYATADCALADNNVSPAILAMR